MQSLLSLNDFILYLLWTQEQCNVDSWATCFLFSVCTFLSSSVDIWEPGGSEILVGFSSISQRVQKGKPNASSWDGIVCDTGKGCTWDKAVGLLQRDIKRIKKLYKVQRRLSNLTLCTTSCCFYSVIYSKK